jgi:hypothetical protein
VKKNDIKLSDKWNTMFFKFSVIIDGSTEKGSTDLIGLNICAGKELSYALIDM